MLPGPARPRRRPACFGSHPLRGGSRIRRRLSPLRHPFGSASPPFPLRSGHPRSVATGVSPGVLDCGDDLSTPRIALLPWPRRCRWSLCHSRRPKPSRQARRPAAAGPRRTALWLCTGLTWKKSRRDEELPVPDRFDKMARAPEDDTLSAPMTPRPVSGLTFWTTLADGRHPPAQAGRPTPLGGKGALPGDQDRHGFFPAEADPHHQVANESLEGSPLA